MSRPKTQSNYLDGSFPGFDRPESNFFRLPNNWTDITSEMTTLAEVKVVEYVLRHTWGWQEYGVKKKITTDEFMNGRKRHDGIRFDKGTGLGKKAVIDGLRMAIKHGFLMEEVDDSDKARTKKYYSLRMLPVQAGDPLALEPEMELDNPDATLGFEDRTPDVRNSNPSSSNSEQRSEKDTLERHYTKDTLYISNGKTTLRDSLIQSEPDPVPQREGRGVTRISDALADAPSRLARARANPETLPSGVPPNLAHYVTAWSRELHDSEHVKSNITQAFRLMQQTGMSETAFMQKLTEARAITKERGNIKKPAREYGEFGTKNKAPYWFAVLRDLLGMKEKSDSGLVERNHSHA